MEHSINLLFMIYYLLIRLTPAGASIENHKRQKPQLRRLVLYQQLAHRTPSSPINGVQSTPYLLGSSTIS